MRAQEDPFIDYLLGSGRIPREQVGQTDLRRESDEVLSEWIEKRITSEEELAEAREYYRSTLEQSVVEPGVDALFGAVTEHLAGQQVGPYLLDSKIGQGGQGSVWRARKVTGLREQVAVKILLRAQRSGSEARLELEARVLLGLKSPCVVAYRDFGTTDELTWMAMEFVEGASAGEIVRKNGPFDPDVCTRILEDVLTGLIAANEQGILHRDLTANNVMLRAVGGRALLTDFGLAKTSQAGHSLSAEGAILGTAAYIAPEVYEGRPYTVQSDLWAVGVLAVVLSTGRMPFDGSTIPAISHNVCNADPRLGDMKPFPLLQAFARELLQKKPEHRPATAAAAREILRGGAVPRRPPERKLRPVILVAVLLIAAVGGGWGLSGLVRGGVGPAPDLAAFKKGLDELQAKVPGLEAGAAQVPELLEKVRALRAEVSRLEKRTGKNTRALAAFDKELRIVELAENAPTQKQVGKLWVDFPEMVPPVHDGESKLRSECELRIKALERLVRLRSDLDGLSGWPADDLSSLRARANLLRGEFERWASEIEGWYNGPMDKNRDAQRRLANHVQELSARSSIPAQRELPFPGDSASGYPWLRAQDWNLKGLDTAVELRRDVEDPSPRSSKDWRDLEKRVLDAAMPNPSWIAELEKVLSTNKAGQLAQLEKDVQNELARGDSETRPTDVLEKLAQGFRERAHSLGAQKVFESTLELFDGLVEDAQGLERLAADNSGSSTVVSRCRWAERIKEWAPAYEKAGELLLSVWYPGDWPIPKGMRPALHSKEKEIDQSKYPVTIEHIKSGIIFILVPRPANDPSVTDSYYLARTETSQAQWRVYMDSGGAEDEGGFPKTGVTYFDVTKFLDGMNQSRFLDALNESVVMGEVPFRLPTVEEWGYACLAGRKAEPGRETHCDWSMSTPPGILPVRPVQVDKAGDNGWGLLGMNGNVTEWCADRWPGSREELVRTVCGGAFCFPPELCTSSAQIGARESVRDARRGFRVAMDLPGRAM